MMLHVAKEAVEAARAAGAHYADARFVHEDSESITVRNQEMEGIDRATSEGVGVRVLVDGYWGFAATARSEGAEIARTASLAVEIARAAARLPREPVKLTDVEPATGTWASPFQDDPFNVSLEEKVALLMEATRRMQEIDGLAFAEGGIDLYRVRTSFASSEGSAIEQTVLHSGAGLDATAVSEGELQRRSYPNSFRGHIAAAGWEHIAKLGLVEEAERTATEAVELLSATDCPSEMTTLVLDSGQMELQVHESIGHAVELDRVLGMEESYAGSSFVSPTDRGKLRYASDLVSITADATIPGGLGSFGWDDEGVPAQRVPIIVDGTFQDFISSRETAGAIGGTSTGAMRADGWGNLPLIRMTNINIEPGDGSLADIIGDTKDGIFMATNQS
ncbi:MAG TPA: TldD/PmbA family protein, partial [Actinomycetota bacterium]